MELRVARAIHRAHPAFAEARHDLVRTEPRARSDGHVVLRLSRILSQEVIARLEDARTSVEELRDETDGENTGRLSDIEETLERATDDLEKTLD
jgi:hypothetical protein